VLVDLGGQGQPGDLAAAMVAELRLPLRKAGQAFAKDIFFPVGLLGMLAHRGLPLCLDSVCTPVILNHR